MKPVHSSKPVGSIKQVEKVDGEASEVELDHFRDEEPLSLSVLKYDHKIDDYATIKGKYTSIGQILGNQYSKVYFIKDFPPPILANHNNTE